MVALSELGARGAADAVRNGEQTAEALAEALLARCAASPLNAFISLEADRLRAPARAADQRRQRGERLGPLHGVPLALKDNIDTADFPTTGGTPALAAHRPKRNAPIVQHLLDAGAIVLGKTNLQELAYGPTNNNAAFGPARNPYDPTRIPGGSSGGSAAAVAARLAPAALGTDTGGSIRVPAALCGITSMRPTTLRWSQAGIVPLSHPVTPPDRWRVMLPTACSSTASSPAVRPRSRPRLSKACASGCRAAISGKISTPSSP
jgi:mandelamide amidase